MLILQTWQSERDLPGRWVSQALYKALPAFWWFLIGIPNISHMFSANLLHRVSKDGLIMNNMVRRIKTDMPQHVQASQQSMEKQSTYSIVLQWEIETIDIVHTRSPLFF